MPLFGRKKDEAKRNYEHKIHLARHAPDLVIDLSDCQLSHIPAEAVSLCKVLLKQVLILSNNKLTSLTTESHDDALQGLRGNLLKLDCSNNQLKKLPNSLCELSRLKFLDLSRNKLAHLPNDIARLQQLEYNHIEILPESLCELIKLQKLDITDNRITKLPKYMYKLTNLTYFDCDAHAMTEPPADICSKGIDAIREYTKENTNDVTDNVSPHTFSTEGSDEAAHKYIDPFEEFSRAAKSRYSLRDNRTAANAASEKVLMEAHAAHAHLLAMQHEQRQELLERLAQEQRETEARVNSIADEQQRQRQRLLNDIQKAESRAQQLLSSIASTNERCAHTERTLELEQQRAMTRKVDKALNALTEQRKAEIRQQMAMQLHEKSLLQNVYERSRQVQAGLVDEVINKDHKEQQSIANTLEGRKAVIDSLTTQINTDAQMQMSAVLALMEKRDARTNRLNKQIEDIMSELQHLSYIEQQQRDQRTADNNKTLSDEREHLVALVMQLIEERQRRNTEMQKRLRQLEQERHDESVDYWMAQYTLLLQTMPAECTEGKMSSELLGILELCEASVFQPIFARNHIHTVEQLAELDEPTLMRVFNVGAREKLLEAALEYVCNTKKLANKERGAESSAAEATTPTEFEPSAPSVTEIVEAHYESECVVCMDRSACIVFAPCGHVCCCAECAIGKTMTTCPLCRADVTARIDVERPLLQPTAPPSE